MHSHKLANLLILSAAMTAAACVDTGTTGTHVGNPGNIGFTVSSALSATPQETQLRFKDDSAVTYTLTQARAHLRRVELYLPNGVSCQDVASLLTSASQRCAEDDDKLQIEGPFILDLLTGESSPSLSALPIPPLAYPRIDYRFDDADAGAVPATDPLSGNSLNVIATFEHQGSPATLTIQLKFNEDARVENGASLALAEQGRLDVDFDIAQWLNAAPIAQCLNDGDLQLQGQQLSITDDTDCDGLEDTLKDNIKDSARLKAR